MPEILVVKKEEGYSLEGKQLGSILASEGWEHRNSYEHEQNRTANICSWQGVSKGVCFLSLR